MRIRIPYSGDRRIIKKFALFPIIAGNEIRWLEMVIVHQSYNTKHRGWNNDWFE